MEKITRHPVLEIPEREKCTFTFNGHTVQAECGQTIAAALHQAGFPVHSHSLKGRNRSLSCGIGKCGACEMLVDGEIKRICITPVDGVREVSEKDNSCLLPQGAQAQEAIEEHPAPRVLRTDVAIVGAGPAGLACRETLTRLGLSTIVIDKNEEIGGQFLMQTHAFFFFEKERRFGGMRGFDIAKTLAGDDHSGIMLHSTVWDIEEHRRLAVKDLHTGELFYIEPRALAIATGALPFTPAFENDDLPGVYTAAVMQKMMNQEFTLLGKRVLTVGAGNIGYLTSYQLMQAGAKIKAIIEGMPREGGFPVQANRVRRLGIPILTSHVLLKAIPNEQRTGITGAVIARCENFRPIPGSERIIDGIDAINLCTGLRPDSQLLTKGEQLFGKLCVGVGDSVRIGEGTSAVLRGKQAAYELAQLLGVPYPYDQYLQVSKEYIESQQKPVKRRDAAPIPTGERLEKPFVRLNCLYGFACNPCSFACPHGAITKQSTDSTPQIDYDKCIGCMQCISQCPGLAIFGYDRNKERLFLPVEYSVSEGEAVYLVNDQGEKLGEGVIEKVMKKENKTHVARIGATAIDKEALCEVTGFIVKSDYPEPLQLKPVGDTGEGKEYICHCEDVTLADALAAIGDRRTISVDEIKHITRIGMGSCRGSRCLNRLRGKLREHGIELTGDATPRAPMQNRITLGDAYTGGKAPQIVAPVSERRRTQVLIAGGGMAGSALFRYFSEAGMKSTLINADRGSSWRNIAGGRPAFSVPELSEIARQNQEIFKEIQNEYDINYRETRYITFAHDDATYRSLEQSCAWSNAYLIDKKDFIKEVSPYFNPRQTTYFAAQVSKHCWQATPGRTIDFVRHKGCQQGGEVLEETRLIDLHRDGDKYVALLYTHNHKYVEYECDHFVNALGYQADLFAKKLGLKSDLYAVKHQALITQRLPMLGQQGDILDMLIDRRRLHDYSAVYGQQLASTGQIIACASPAVNAMEVVKDYNDVKLNSQTFIDVISEVFCNWIPALGKVPVQATWAGYYVEPRYIIDPAHGLFVGMQGHGFMLSQHLAKLYVDKALGRPVPEYMQRLELEGTGISEKAFK